MENGKKNEEIETNFEQSIFEQINNLLYDIYRSFRPARKFKFATNFRKKRVYRQYKRIASMIESTIGNCDTIDNKTIYDYFIHLGINLPPEGHYGHTTRIQSEDLETKFAAAVDFNFYHRSKYGCRVIVIYDNTKDILEYGYLTESDKTKERFSFTDLNSRWIAKVEVDNQRELLQLQSVDPKKAADVLRFEFFMVLREDIKNYLLERVAFYKERIEKV